MGMIMGIMFLSGGLYLETIHILSHIYIYICVYIYIYIYMQVIMISYCYIKGVLALGLPHLS